MSKSKAIEICKKYLTAKQYFDNLIEMNWVDLSPGIENAIHQVAKKILNELEKEDE